MSHPYTRPMLSKAFAVIAVACGLVALFAMIAAVVDTSNGHSGHGGWFTAVVAISLAAIYLGIGEVIAFLNRSSAQSERIASLLANELGPQLKRIEDLLGSPARTAPPSTKDEYFYAKDGAEAGPFTAADIRSLRAEGAITDTTSVFRTGDKDWLPLSQFPDLMKRRAKA
jgi:hypothetical protein